VICVILNFSRNDRRFVRSCSKNTPASQCHTTICRFLPICSLLLLLQTFELRTYARMHIPTILQTPEEVEMAVGEENFIWILDEK
jgi:hypothetical protein